MCGVLTATNFMYKLKSFLRQHPRNLANNDENFSCIAIILKQGIQILHTSYYYTIGGHSKYFVVGINILQLLFKMHSEAGVFTCSLFQSTISFISMVLAAHIMQGQGNSIHCTIPTSYLLYSLVVSRHETAGSVFFKVLRGFFGALLGRTSI